MPDNVLSNPLPPPLHPLPLNPSHPSLPSLSPPPPHSPLGGPLRTQNPFLPFCPQPKTIIILLVFHRIILITNRLSHLQHRTQRSGEKCPLCSSYEKCDGRRPRGVTEWKGLRSEETGSRECEIGGRKGEGEGSGWWWCWKGGGMGCGGGEESFYFVK